MQTNELYSIGQMSKICNISIQTLRYYDKIGLLNPEVKKEGNGYRYYDRKQILYIKIIQQLRECDFALEDIKKFMVRNDLSIILRLLIEKKNDIREQIINLESIEDKITAHIKNLQMTNQSHSLELIELRNLPPRTVAYTRYNSPCNPDVFAMRYNELQNIIKKNKWVIEGNQMAIFHDHPSVFDYNNADIEVCVKIRKPVHECRNIRTILGGLFVTALHNGHYDTQPTTYRSMVEWTKKNGYEITGPSIERYIIDTFYTKNPQKYITELQFPVRKL